MPPDCSTVHMLMMGAMPMVVPWKYTPLPQGQTEDVWKGDEIQGDLQHLGSDILRFTRWEV